MKFKTQVCTTKEQSERLLALGLKEETADCYHWEYLNRRFVGEQVKDGITANDIPAWSLHRLIAMCPNCLYTHPCLHKTITDRSIFYCEENNKEEYEKPFSEFLNLYDNIIACIEWLVKEGYFNEEYLEENK